MSSLSWSGLSRRVPGMAPPPPPPVVSAALNSTKTTTSFMDTLESSVHHGGLFTDAVHRMVMSAEEERAGHSAEDINAMDRVEDMMRHDLAYFASEILQGPTEAPYNGEYVVAPHHEEWSDLVATHQRLCIQAARDHGKTFFLTFAYAIWQSWRVAGNEGIIISAAVEHGEKILEEIKEELESNPKLQYLVPRDTLTRVWTKTRIKLSNGSVIKVKSFGTALRGNHPKWVVCDDVLKDEDARSETTRENNIEFFLSAVANMPSPTPEPTIGQLLVVGTPFHANDLFGYLEANEVWAFFRFAAEDDKGVPLWSLRYSRERLDAKRKEIGSLRYSREFLCRPVSGVSSLFPPELFNWGFRALARLGDPREAWLRKGVEVFYAGVDIATSAQSSADWFVVFVIGVDSRGNRWVVDIHRSQGLGYDEQKHTIGTLCRKYGCELVFIESNAAQRIYASDLAQTTDLPVQPVHTGSEKHGLVKGVPSMRPLFENRKYRIPRGDENSIKLTDKWIAEMGSFTFDGEVKSVGKHDDVAMASWIAEKALRTGLFSFGIGESASEQEAYDEVYGYMHESSAANDGDVVYGVPSLSMSGGGDGHMASLGFGGFGDLQPAPPPPTYQQTMRAQPAVVDATQLPFAAEIVPGVPLTPGMIAQVAAAGSPRLGATTSGFGGMLGVG